MVLYEITKNNLIEWKIIIKIKWKKNGYKKILFI